MMTHDYNRHGTTTLFAALDVKTGKVIGDCMPRHPLPGSGLLANHERGAKEFLKFLRSIDKAVPARSDVNLILDNYATHKTPEVKAWLDKHPRFKLHFTPTSASWLNLVERFFAEITSRRIRRSSYSSVDDLKAAIFDYLAQHNDKPKPFKWTKTAEDILTRERRALDKLDEIRGNR
jgi:transposase